MLPNNVSSVRNLKIWSNNQILKKTANKRRDERNNKQGGGSLAKNPLLVANIMDILDEMLMSVASFLSKLYSHFWQ